MARLDDFLGGFAEGFEPGLQELGRRRTQRETEERQSRRQIEKETRQEQSATRLRERIRQEKVQQAGQEGAVASRAASVAGQLQEQTGRGTAAQRAQLLEELPIDIRAKIPFSQLKDFAAGQTAEAKTQGGETIFPTLEDAQKRLDTVKKSFPGVGARSVRFTEDGKVAVEIGTENPLAAAQRGLAERLTQKRPAGPGFAQEALSRALSAIGLGQPPTPVGIQAPRIGAEQEEAETGARQSALQAEFQRQKAKGLSDQDAARQASRILSGR